jgi:hypothetical protein
MKMGSRKLIRSEERIYPLISESDQIRSFDGVFIRV